MQNRMIAAQPTPHDRLYFVPTSKILIPPAKLGITRCPLAHRLVGRQDCPLGRGGGCNMRNRGPGHHTNRRQSGPQKERNTRSDAQRVTRRHAAKTSQTGPATKRQNTVPCCHGSKSVPLPVIPKIQPMGARCTTSREASGEWRGTWAEPSSWGHFWSANGLLEAADGVKKVPNGATKGLFIICDGLNACRPTPHIPRTVTRRRTACLGCFGRLWEPAACSREALLCSLLRTRHAPTHAHGTPTSLVLATMALEDTAKIHDCQMASSVFPRLFSLSKAS